ncbi:hypothetical protein PGN76_15385 [Klebsiella aerogenes]
MTVRAKFACHFIQKPDDDSFRVIHLSAVTSDSAENKSWSKYTPAGDIKLHVSNPDAFEQFEQGKEYFIDISSAE